MEQNNKILIMAVIVLLVGVVAFNFNTISGAQTKEDVTRVRVSPTTGVCDLSSGYGQGRVSFYLDISGKAPDSKVLIYELDTKLDTKRKVDSQTVSSKSSLEPGRYQMWLACDPKLGSPLVAGVRNPSSGKIYYSNKFEIISE